MQYSDHGKLYVRVGKSLSSVRVRVRGVDKGVWVCEIRVTGV